MGKIFALFIVCIIVFFTIKFCKGVDIYDQLHDNGIKGVAMKIWNGSKK